MTPGARIAAAIAVLDQIIAGDPAEQALTAWARGSRFAGSKDRAAVRDHVYDVLRSRRSLGDGTGRSLMQRLALREGWPLDTLFSGDGHAPAPLTDDERTALAAPLALNDAARCDIPDWLWPMWEASLGDQAEAVAMAQQQRADVFLRVNLRRGTVAQAQTRLAAEGVETQVHPTVAGCLRVVENARKVKTALAYAEGLVELQDAASQFAIAAVPLPKGAKLLDYCAGGGGKALGFADRPDVAVYAHDIAPQRLRDLPVRAARAGVNIKVLGADSLAAHGSFDVVFCDAPCSGSGTWRRTPDAKWGLTAQKLDAVMQSQVEVLAAAAPLVAAGGILAYATCSVLDVENDAAVQRFQAQNPQWISTKRYQLLPDRNGDGFYLCLLTRT